MAEKGDFPPFNTQQGLYAAIQLVRWTGQQTDAGLDLLTLCATMITVGATLAAGSPEQPQEWRSMWARWLRVAADDIEAGRPVGPIGHS